MKFKVLRSQVNHKVSASFSVGIMNGIFTFFFLLMMTSAFSQTVLDSSYGTNGKSVVQTGFENDPFDFYSNFNSAVATKDSGVLTFESTVYYDAPRDILRKFTKDGAVDTTFANRGSLQFIGYDGKAIVQPDGKILISYYYDYYFDGFFNRFYAVRLLPNGQYDPTFGSNGVASFRIGDKEGSAEIAYSIALKPDGKIVIAGEMNNFLIPGHYTVLQLLPNGQPDTLFGKKGYLVATLPVESTAIDIKTLPDNKIVVLYNSRYISSAAIIQYTAKGKIDSSVANNGVYTNLVPSRYMSLYISDGSLYVSSKSTNIYKFMRNGTLDSTFGSNGVLQLDGNYSRFLSFDRKGSFYINNQSNFSVTKFTKHGLIDADFGTQGTAGTTFSEFGYNSPGADAPVVVGDNQVVLVGKAYNAYIAIALAKFTTKRSATSILYIASDKKAFPAAVANYSKIVLQPNPAHNYVYIRNLPLTPSDLTLLSGSGAVLQTFHNVSGSYTVAVSKLPAGVYYIVVSGVTKPLSFIKE